MTIAELYEIHTQLISIINEVWQLWLGGTFAFIVAFHVGRESLDKAVFWIGSTIYSLASLILMFRFVDYGVSLGGIIAKVAAAGGDPLQPTGWSTFYAPLTVVFMFFGTIAAVWYAHRSVGRQVT